MKKSFNIIIATLGRPGLQRMLDSITPQLDYNDYLTIIWDGTPIPINTVMCKCPIISIRNPVKLGYYGHGSRNFWQDKLPGDYFMNADDDDIYTPDAMKVVREKCTEHKLYIFKIVWKGGIIPADKNIRHANISTQCGVYPPGNLPEWGTVYHGDFLFYQELGKRLPVEFCDHIIYRMRNY